jgi:PhnB protein
MQLETHLSFDGQCEAAFRFYEECFGGKVSLMMKYGDSPLAEKTPRDLRNKILHAVVLIGDQRLTGSDAPAERYQKPRGFAVTVSLADAALAERIFGRLAQGGTVEMPLQETFWAQRFGMLVDRFGTPWEINCGKGPAATS